MPVDSTVLTELVIALSAISLARLDCNIASNSSSSSSKYIYLT